MDQAKRDLNEAIRRAQPSKAFLGHVRGQVLEYTNLPHVLGPLMMAYYKPPIDMQVFETIFIRRCFLHDPSMNCNAHWRALTELCTEDRGLQEHIARLRREQLPNTFNPISLVSSCNYAS